MEIHYEWGVTGALKASQRGDICIVIDIFRASSTIVTALAVGFLTIKPTQTWMAKPPNYLTAGESNGEKISACDFGNSPCEIIASQKRADKLLIKTTNGSRCIENINNPAAVVLIGCMLNATSVAEIALTLSKKNNKNISFVLAGCRGEYCEDDDIAGKFIAEIIQRKRQAQPICKQLYSDTRDLLLKSAAAQRLITKGHADDVSFCTQWDCYAIAPVYHILSKEITALLAPEKVNI